MNAIAMKLKYFLLLAVCSGVGMQLPAADPPRIQHDGRSAQLIVDGKPFLVLGGELGNSSAGTAEQADIILPRLHRLHVNTVLMPVAWEQLEPSEGQYDFSILDHWIDVARDQQMHLVPLWFGSWKNGFSNYAPQWVKQDTKRFPRAISSEGGELEILSTLGDHTVKADAKAFHALMQHIGERDRGRNTVLFVQVENEVGYLGHGRDRSAEANRLFGEGVPAALMAYLRAHRESLSAELAGSFHPEGRTWPEAFGDAADEVFMAWRYATYIEQVAASGKQAYVLPMYVNVQLPAPAERAGQYPSGGPHPYYLAVYQAAAPSLDFYSPDIYWPNFEYWIDRYRFAGNAVFVPETQLEAGDINAWYAYGEARAFGFSPFGIDSVAPSDGKQTPASEIEQTYGVLEGLAPILRNAVNAGRTRAFTLHASSPRPTRTVSLGGYLFEGSLLRSWPAKTLMTEDGAMLAIESASDEFWITGRGLTVSFERDPDVDDRAAGIASIEEMEQTGGSWKVHRRLNGDQSNQGRQLSMDAKDVRVYRVRLYHYERAKQR